MPPHLFHPHTLCLYWHRSSTADCSAVPEAASQVFPSMHSFHRKWYHPWYPHHPCRHTWYRSVYWYNPYPHSTGNHCGYWSPVGRRALFSWSGAKSDIFREMRSYTGRNHGSPDISPVWSSQARKWYYPGSRHYYCQTVYYKIHLPHKTWQVPCCTLRLHMHFLPF